MSDSSSAISNERLLAGLGFNGYDEKYVREFVENSGNVLLVAYAGDKVAGVCLASKNYAPYKDNESWLFIDEVDVSADYRRQGIGKNMMEELFKIGAEIGTARSLGRHRARQYGGQSSI